MPYKISGTKSETSRIIVIKESDWSIESNTMVSGSGAYSVADLETGVKSIISRNSDGEVISYGNVDSVYSAPLSRLWAWGYNIDGQLGLGDTDHRSSPVQVGSDTDWSAVSGGFHTIALKSNGTLWTSGKNSHGQLGQEDITNRSSHVQIGSSTDWATVVGDGLHSFSIKTGGTLWSWGYNTDYGQLGLDDRIDRSSPTQVGSLTNWSDIDSGGYQAVAIKSDGTMWSWGRNHYGQLGLGDTNHRSSPVQIGSDTDWSGVSNGYTHTKALKTDGTMWGWGQNYTGDNPNVPTKIGSDTDWSAIACSFDVTLALKTDGTLWAWGTNNHSSNDYGQLGLGNIDNVYSVPTQVGSDTDWSGITRGYQSSSAIKTDGTIWGWGKNDVGQLGLGDTNHRSSPTQVGALTDWTEVACGITWATLALR